jgi:O-methyltransferase
MKILKMATKKILSALGYELTRSSGPRASFDNRVMFDNFVNLAQAYEQRLNESNNFISPNEIRPKLLARLLGTPPSLAYFIVQALAKCKDISGDVCEFGVAQGETSALIANEIARSSNKILHLFDSFEGLPKPSEKDELKDDIFSLGSMEAYTGMMSCPEDMVRTRLKSISFPSQRYVIHKGFIEQLIHTDQNLPEEVCFAYVDFDFYEPIKVTLDFLHQITPIGAIVIVDDYDFFSVGSKTAVDEFIEEKNSSEMLYECFVPNTRYGYFAVLTKKGSEGTSIGGQGS